MRADGHARLLIVDAMNVIGSRPTGWWRDRPGAVRHLAARLRAYAQHHRVAVTVVVDGRPLPELPEGEHGRLRVAYAARPGPDAADDRIVELVDDHRDEPVEVATADRDLRRRVEDLGAAVMRPGELLRALDRLEQAER